MSLEGRCLNRARRHSQECSLTCSSEVSASLSEKYLHRRSAALSGSEEEICSKALVSLPRWSGSKGAYLERKAAEELGLPVFNYRTFVQGLPGTSPRK